MLRPTPRPTPLRETLELDFGGEERVPAISQRPPAPGAAPGVLLLHGFSSRKERIANESHMAIRYLATRPEVDASRIGIAGYSLGAFLATVVAAENQLVRKIAGPIRAVRSLNGRPLLMVNAPNGSRAI